MNADRYVGLDAEQTQKAQFCEGYLGLEKEIRKLSIELILTIKLKSE
jgi:hypothetical protein